MEKDLGNYRKSYGKSALSELSMSDDPMVIFEEWFVAVEASGAVQEPNAMTVSTIGADGFPKSRVVLLKQYNSDGFVFYTNYQSEKGRAIAANRKVGLSFFWPQMERQVIIKGEAVKVPSSQSSAYFASRPRGSQLGALVSDQSEVIASRQILEDKLRSLEKEYENRDVLRPEHWGGYIVRPLSIEFWQGRPNRLHDRIRFTKLENQQWQKQRLSP